MSRAMTASAKLEKKNFILEQAFKIYEESSFSQFRMIDLAHACKLSKGILFRYFNTKEILFFHMLDIEYEKMFRILEDEFLKYEVIDIDVLKETLIYLTRTLFQPDTLLVRLSRIQNVILEQNIDYEFAAEHKLKMAKLSAESMKKISKRFSGINLTQFGKIFSVHSALLYGYLHSCTTSPIIKKVIKEYDLKQFDMDPLEETIDALSIYIDGYFNK